MASIIKKIIRGRPYYYARVCKRVDGKPKIVSQTYLGRADKIIEKLRAAPVPAQPLEAVVREFGASTALLALARRLQLVEHIDRHVPKRGSGPSVGAYLLAAVLNRCLAPGSKASLARWFDSSVLGRLLPLRSSQLTSQRFWDHMHRVPVSALPAIERDIVAAMTRSSASTCAKCCLTPPTSSPTSILSTSAPSWPSAATARRAAGRCASSAWRS